jgi:aspartate-semialdehyde dehydrogenase
LAETIALVGSETLLGREVREVFGETALGENLRLVANADVPGGEDESLTLTEIGGDPAVIGKLDPDAIEDAAVVILAGSPESSKIALDTQPSGVIIDLTWALEEEPDARVRAPRIEGPDATVDHSGPQIVAHPAAIAIASVLKRLHEAFPIQRAIVQIFEPASERGTPGIEELQQQTVNLLSFQPLPKKVFDAQLGFALLAELGSEAKVKLQDVEDRIERHLASLLERTEGVPMPSLRLIQAPVFHGYSFSFWIEFEEAPAVSDVEEAMNQEPFDVRTGDFEPPNNVGVAGQGTISIGAIAPDRNAANAIWMWAAIDNLRLAAENTALIASEVI